MEYRTDTDNNITHTHNYIPKAQDYGSFFGSPVLAIPQRHVIGTTTFVHDDETINVIASDEKPIKCVYEGDPLIINGDLYKNYDLTQEYMYSDKHGMQLVLPSGNTGFGRYSW